MNRVSPRWLAGGVLALLFGAVFFPLLRDPVHTTAASISRDNYFDFWSLWWFREAVAHGENPFFTRMLYHPNGTSLYFVEFGPFYGLLALPLTSLLGTPDGPVFAHNLFVLGSFLATGTLAFGFARWATGSIPGALLAAVAVTLAPFRFHHLEYPNLLSGYWIFAAARLAGGWCLRPGVLAPNGDPPEPTPTPSRWNLLLLALCALGTALTSTTVFAMTVFFLTLWLGLSFLIQPDRWHPGRTRRLTAAAGAYALGAMPVIWGWLSAVFHHQAPLYETPAILRWGPDLLGFFLPQGSFLLGRFFQGIGAGLHGPGGKEIYLGWGLLAAAAFGAARRPRRALPFVLVSLVAWLVCLGPVLWVGGKSIDLPFTPYGGLIDLVPFFAASRTPERFLLAAVVPLVPLAAAGFERLRRGTRSRWVLGGLAALVVVELLPPPIAVERVTVDPVYRTLAADPVPGAVLELSMNPDLLNDFLFHQMIHRRPIVGGPLARPSPKALEFQQRLDLYRRLSYPETSPAALADLKRGGVAFLVLHRGEMGEESWNFLVRSYADHASLVEGGERRAVYRLAE